MTSGKLYYVYYIFQHIHNFNIDKMRGSENEFVSQAEYDMAGENLDLTGRTEREPLVVKSLLCSDLEIHSTANRES